MYLPFPSILITIFIIITVKADVEIIAEKNDSCGNELNQSSVAINSSLCDIIRTLDGHEWSQAEENVTSLSSVINGHVVEQKVTSTESTKTHINDNFEDLRGRISVETLDLIKRLHMLYLNTENSNKQSTSLSSGENKSRKEEIIHVSGKLEIL
ncbi:hypothetical protein LOAG_09893 [Loa loa]|uniref:Uncharacterized protein n=1 Tax=Loa loa TaxID=7209 RepID=A0A1I7VG52_LOALO|nr:hypothetical protein LOAG_09893 [Loa loa]EFO18601.2 hypothetical protein LOAG_09893 [Loa loa]